MNDDDKNIIKLHPKDFETFRAAIDRPPEPNAVLRDLMENPNIPIPVNLPDGAHGQIEIGNLGFDDIGAAFNMRDWLQKACEAKGAKMVGGGFGFGQADIDIELDDFRFNISIRPLP